MAKAPTEIRSLARSHTETAINVLVGIMNKTEAPEAARVSAANSLLDRGWGKPSQEIDMKHDVSDQIAELMKAIDGRTRGLPKKDDPE